MCQNPERSDRLRERGREGGVVIERERVAIVRRRERKG